jgi:hypothetical protein
MAPAGQRAGVWGAEGRWMKIIFISQKKQKEIKNIQGKKRK